jgi:N-methylhydantoinase B
MMLHNAPEGQIRGVAMGLAGLRNSGQGLFGGLPGAPSLLVLAKDTKVHEVLSAEKHVEDLEVLGGDAKLLPYSEFAVGKSDVLYFRASSGGGYGDPLDRDPEKVLRDIVDGFVSSEVCRKTYGVVLNERSRVDAGKTDELRTRLRQERINNTK